MNSKKFTNRKKMLVITLLIGVSLLLGSCFSLSYTSKHVSKADVGFWFALNPEKLLEEDGGFIFAPKTGKREIDPLLTKNEILINSLRKEKAQKWYTPEQIQYEIEMTLAMIDSRDPIEIFQGKAIELARPTHKLLLEQRKELMLYKK